MAYVPTLKKKYQEEIIPALKKEFDYSSVMQVPKLEKIVLNQGVGAAIADKKLIEVARKSGAQAVHPGYGFLSENAEFAQLCADEGLVFIGPSPEAIRRMGDKGIARATMKAAGVPVVPGTEGEQRLRDEELLAEAGKIGFPLLIKATAGGGGKGMRVVTDLSEMAADFSRVLQARVTEAREHVAVPQTRRPGA